MTSISSFVVRVFLSLRPYQVETFAYSSTQESGCFITMQLHKRVCTMCLKFIALVNFLLKLRESCLDN